MNGNGQVIIPGLLLLTSIAAAAITVGMFELPTYEPEAKPLKLLDLEADVALLNPVPIELLLQYTGTAYQGLKPEQIYHGVIGQTLAKAAAVDRIQSHRGLCSGLHQALTSTTQTWTASTRGGFSFLNFLFAPVNFT